MLFRSIGKNLEGVETTEKISSGKKLHAEMNIELVNDIGTDISIPGTGGDQIHVAGQ